MTNFYESEFRKQSEDLMRKANKQRRIAVKASNNKLIALVINIQFG